MNLNSYGIPHRKLQPYSTINFITNKGLTCQSQ